MKFDVPNPKPDVDANGDFHRAWTPFFDRLRDGVVLRSQHGTTAQRPTKQLEVGLTYFDTTLGLAIWLKTVSPVVWVNGAGVAV